MMPDCSQVRIDEFLVVRTLKMLNEARCYTRMENIVRQYGKLAEQTENIKVRKQYNRLLSDMEKGLTLEAVHGPYSQVKKEHPFVARNWPNFFSGQVPSYFRH